MTMFIFFLKFTGLHLLFSQFILNYLKMRVLILIIVGLVTTWAEVVNLNNDPMFSNFFSNFFQLLDQNKKSPSVGDSNQREVSTGGVTSKSYQTKTGIDGTKTTTQTTTSADGSQVIVQTIISPNGSKTVNTLKTSNKVSEPTRKISNNIQQKQGTEGGKQNSNTILSDGIKNISQTIVNLNETRPVSQIKQTQASKNISKNLTENNKTILRNDKLGQTVTQTKIDSDGKRTVTKTTISPEGRKTVTIQTSWDSKIEIPLNKSETLNSQTKNSYVTENKSIINETDYSKNKSANFLNPLNDKINNAQNQPIQQKWKAELSRHNMYRLKHGAPALLYSAQLSQIAQGFAQKLSSIRGLVLYHSGNTFQGQSAGQNLYRASYNPNGGQATDSWYDEINQYAWDGQFSSATGHFTQLIWKDSKYVGFGFSGGVVVANYYPAGNFIGRFQQNVLRPIN